MVKHFYLSAFHYEVASKNIHKTDLKHIGYKMSQNLYSFTHKIEVSSLEKRQRERERVSKRHCLKKKLSIEFNHKTAMKYKCDFQIRFRDKKTRHALRILLHTHNESRYMIKVPNNIVWSINQVIL